MKGFESLTQKILELPLDERALLAEMLLESLEQLTPAEIQQLWADEAERRLAAYRAGDIEAVPGPEAHRQILDDIR